LRALPALRRGAAGERQARHAGARGLEGEARGDQGGEGWEVNVNGLHIGGSVKVRRGSALECPFQRAPSVLRGIGALAAPVERPELRAAGGASGGLKPCGNGIPLSESRRDGL
jgi:hypothetical protein